MIDLHMHTTYSDGSKTLEEVLKMCETKKLEYISITDHNTCEAYYDKALKDSIFFTGTIIKGCELNAEFQNRCIEILGYNVNTDIIMEWRQKYYSKEKIKETAERLGFTSIILCENLKEAVSVCAEKANPGEAVLLSPACASWGQFANYEQRGDMFKEYVRAL